MAELFDPLQDVPKDQLLLGELWVLISRPALLYLVQNNLQL
jgi:hypothetical protein